MSPLELVAAKGILMILLAGAGSPSMATPIRYEDRVLHVDEAAEILASMVKPVSVALSLENGVATMTVRPDSTEQPPGRSALLARIADRLGPADSVRISSEVEELELARHQLVGMIRSYRLGSGYGIGADRLDEPDTAVKWVIRVNEAGVAGEL